MEDLLVDIVELLILFLWLAPIIIVGLTWFWVRGLSKAPEKLIDADPKKHAYAFEKAVMHQDWASENGFKAAGTWVFDGADKTFLAVWEHQQDPTYFVFYYSDSRSYIDFVTRLSDDHAVTTSSSSEALFFPMPPGFYMEVYTGVDKDTLLLKHRRSVEFVKTKLPAGTSLSNLPLKAVVTNAIDRQVDYIRQLPLWPFRGIYWFLFRRQARLNKSIEQLWREA